VTVVIVLVSAASRHDATREIAEAPAAGLAKRGVDADARPLEQITSLDAFDTVVLGSAIYLGRWLKSAREFVSEHAAELSSMPVWLLRSGPLGPPDRLIPSGESADTDRIVELVGALGHGVFAGRLERMSLGLAERAAAKAVHAPKGDCRDRAAVGVFAGETVSELAAKRAVR
jgi:menaquinone-dependent protoporphyrinogen oxidase